MLIWANMSLALDFCWALRWPEGQSPTSALCLCRTRTPKFYLRRNLRADRKNSGVDFWEPYLAKAILMGKIVLMPLAKRGGAAVWNSGRDFVVAVASEWREKYWRSLREWKRAVLGKENSILEGEVLVGLWQISLQFEMVTDILFFCENLRL